MSRKFFFVICLFFYVLQPCAQDFEEALLKSSEILKENSYEIELEHLIYNLTGDRLIEREKIEILRDDDNYYIFSYGIEKIRNSDYQVIINHRTRMIYILSLKKEISDIEKEEQQKMQEDLQMLFAIMKELAANRQPISNENQVHYEGIKTDCHTYSAAIKSGMYEKVEFYFNKRSGVLERCEYITRGVYEVSPNVEEKVRLVILYNKLKKKGRVNKKRFATDEIFYIKNEKEVILKEQYKNYIPVVEL